MDIGIVSMRYAKALIDYAYNSGKEDIMYRDVLAKIYRSV